MSHDLIALDLKGRTPPGASSIDDLPRLIARALSVVHVLIAAEDEPEDLPLLSELQQLAARFHVGAVPEDAIRTSAECLERVRPLANRTREQREEQRRELTAIVKLVREAVSTAGLELDSIHSEIEASGTRIETIVALEDPRQVRDLVKTHVARLKQLVSERRAAWEHQRQSFSDRIEALEQQLQASRQEAALDPLTGAANQGTFDREIQARVLRAGTRLVLAMLDVDNFKAINDTHGHPAGDRVLRAAAEGLRRGTRDNDLVARIGGDEFAVLMDNMTLRQAEIRFTTLLGSLKSEMAAAAGGGASPTVSCGLAELSAGDTIASLYERADQALYSAKRGGRNRVACRTRAFTRDLMRR